MLIVVLALALPFASQDTPERHGRATERSILAPINAGIARSAMFRDLTATLNSSDATVVTAATIRSSSPSAAEFPAMRPIRVLVSNVAEVPPEVVSQAEREVVRLYSGIGITLAWEDHAPADGRTILLLPDQMSLRITILQDDPRRLPGSQALGAAPRRPEEARVACVYYERVEQRARRDGVEPALVLGHAIAHEVGHLLLPAYEHPTWGLMKAVWNSADLRRAAQGQLRFSKEEAALIHAVLARRLSRQ